MTTLARKPTGKKLIKPKKCKSCKEAFIPHSSTQIACSQGCALAVVKAKQERQAKAVEKVERQKRREALEKHKRRGDHLREAQQAFNAFIRERDRQAGHPCISSGRPLDWSGNAVDAGHYRSVGAAPHLRFDERNCHAQSKHDNQFKSGNVVDYRINLIERIGLAAVEALEADNEPRHYTLDELKQLKAHYRAKVRELRKELEV